MAQTKKWFARWDVIGLTGLVLAAAGIAITVYIDRQNKIETAALKCRERGEELEAFAIESAALNVQLDEFESDLDQLRTREGEARGHYQRARKYITALEAELAIGRTSSSFRNAIRSFKLDFGDGAFETASADTWVEYLSAEGYPSALTDRQRLARNMIDWGLESGAANFMVLTPRDEDTSEKLIVALRYLSGSMAVVRDQNYLNGIQGIQDTNGYLTDLERNLDGIAEDIRVRNSSVETKRSATRSSERRLREAERQLEGLSC